MPPAGYANANEERRRILAQQAEAALPYYQENKAEGEEWINLDIIEQRREQN